MDPLLTAEHPTPDNPANATKRLALLLEVVSSMSRLRERSLGYRPNPRHVTAHQLTHYADHLRHLDLATLEPRKYAVTLLKGIGLAESAVRQSQRAYAPSLIRTLFSFITRPFYHPSENRTDQIHAGFVQASDRLLSNLRAMRQQVLAPPAPPITRTSPPTRSTSPRQRPIKRDARRLAVADGVLAASSETTPAYGMTAIRPPARPPEP